MSGGKSSTLKWWHFIIAVIVFIAVCAAAGYLYIERPAGDGSKKTDFVVKSGWGSSAVTSSLARESLIKSRTGFKIMLFITGKTTDIKRGIYTLDDSMRPSKIIDILTSGRTKTVTFTIPEGFNNRQVADELVKKGLFTSKEQFIKLASSPAVLSRFNIKGGSAEGYLFPDTYTVPVGYPAEKIIVLMIEHFFEKVSELNGFPQEPEKRQRFITLASIVEREAKVVNERPLIAAVFINRLKKDMPLESCATIQYLFDPPKKRIYFQDLDKVSPYNTYRNRGLPAGPISNPGLSSLNAVLKPADTDYLFFVVKGNGEHHFSKDYREHLKAKKEYNGESDRDIK
jgi:UPF0755 protein